MTSGSYRISATSAHDALALDLHASVDAAMRAELEAKEGAATVALAYLGRWHWHRLAWHVTDGGFVDTRQIALAVDGEPVWRMRWIVEAPYRYRLEASWIVEPWTLRCRR